MKKLLVMAAILFMAANMRYYAQRGMITKTYDNLAEIETTDGQLWLVEKEDWEEGDHCFLVFDSMNTADYTDDIIRVCWYEGGD